MIWTESDVRCLKKAVMDKAEGKRVTALQLGERLEQFADASLDQLKALLGDATNSVNGPQRPKIFRTRQSKGL